MSKKSPTQVTQVPKTLETVEKSNAINKAVEGMRKNLQNMYNVGVEHGKSKGMAKAWNGGYTQGLADAYSIGGDSGGSVAAHKGCGKHGGFPWAWSNVYPGQQASITGDGGKGGLSGSSTGVDGDGSDPLSLSSAAAEEEPSARIAGTAEVAPPDGTLTVGGAAAAVKPSDDGAAAAGVPGGSASSAAAAGMAANKTEVEPPTARERSRSPH